MFIHPNTALISEALLVRKSNFSYPREGQEMISRYLKNNAAGVAPKHFGAGLIRSQGEFALRICA